MVEEEGQNRKEGDIASGKYISNGIIPLRVSKIHSSIVLVSEFVENVEEYKHVERVVCQ